MVSTALGTSVREKKKASTILCHPKDSAYSDYLSLLPELLKMPVRELQIHRFLCSKQKQSTKISKFIIKKYYHSK